MPTLIVRHPDGSETEHEFSSELKIGRHESNDLPLTEGGVSRQHARVFVENGDVLVEDLNSSNGTYVDAGRVSDPTPLTPQSQVVIGDYELRLKASTRPSSAGRKAQVTRAAPALGTEDGSPRATRALPRVKPSRPAGEEAPKRPARPAPDAGSAPSAGAAPVLRGLTGPWANKTFALKGKLLIGRSPPASVLLEDDSISRKHAEVERTPQGKVMLRDLGSANGTLLNGDVIGPEPVELAPGDVLQFGMVEVVYEPGESDLPVRRERGGVPVRRDREAGKSEVKAASGEGGIPLKRKRLLAVAGGLIGLLLVVGIVSKLTGPAPSDEEIVAPTAPKKDPARELQKLLSECRSFSSMEMGNEPQWEKADVACEKALNIDPINSEANSLIRKIKLEKEASSFYAQGQKALARLKDEEALDTFQKIPKESQYFRLAKVKAREALEQVKVKSLDDCKRYLRDSQWSAAVPRCDRYMGIWCQDIAREELEPPLGFTLSLEGRVGKRQWRPKDKLFVQFLSARRKLDPNAHPWTCPVSEVISGPGDVVDPAGEVKAKFKDVYTNKLMYAAMLDYWAGRGSEALATLQKLRSDYEQSSLHGKADELLTAMSTVDQLFKGGETLLQQDEVERAAEPFDEALEVDKRLMGDLWEKAPSFYRRNIQQDIAERAYSNGKVWTQREDQRRGCRLWKLGFKFYKGNTDLNKAVGFCSTQGLAAFKAAGSCPELQAAADYAVSGDGLEEKIAARREELKCR
ncbi:FHA domain-containing protein [Stigmatella aurantiaca]|uniref:FHA domain protein n=1 Tax=Stigmatella aurantiaca (strain DW4/3-1) TaxID=378806 RepID=Q08QX6_STIAD|nr:FHA domain-containing protein [Stigmatella aurantiaca]ADO72756.1 FHA domain/tetratricopeptide repeat protein [Stigmatella aurantiaca DW4/3-1]EAU62885.1 FHA domain protein [Stigmatella aurantiaca DW4/3-1]